jgi:hypothetical protein
MEGIDATTSGGRLVFHIFAALAEFERTLLEIFLGGLSHPRATVFRPGRSTDSEAGKAG